MGLMEAISTIERVNTEVSLYQGCDPKVGFHCIPPNSHQDPNDPIWKKVMEKVGSMPELNYMTQIHFCLVYSF